MIRSFDGLVYLPIACLNLAPHKYPVDMASGFE
jgi:hypothetical protein